MKDNVNEFLASTYTSDSFGGEVGLLAVREDPSRHIQSTDKAGIYNMFTEILDNALDEITEVKSRLGKDNKDPLYVKVILNQKTGECYIEDQGRGLPLSLNHKHNIPTVCCVYEKDNTGGKGNKSGIQNKGYITKTMGVHGAGAFVVNACSEYLKVRTRVYNSERDCIDEYEIQYNKGIPVESEDFLYNRLKYIGSNREFTSGNRLNTGVTVCFKPDLEVMSLYNPDTEKLEESYYMDSLIKQRIRDTLSTMDCEIVVVLNIDNEEFIYDSRELSYTLNKEEGKDYVSYTLVPDENVMQQLKEMKRGEFELNLLILTSDRNKSIQYFGFVNRIKVALSPHIDTIKFRFEQAIRRMSEQDEELQGYMRKDLLKGLIIIPMLYVDNAQWGGQVKLNYTDTQLASLIGSLFDSRGLFQQIPLSPAVEYCFKISREALVQDKKHQDELKNLQDKREQENLQLENSSRVSNILSADLSYLNKVGEFLFSSNIEDSDLVLVEGGSAGQVFTPIMASMPNIAVFTGLRGKIDNVQNYEKKMKRSGGDLSLQSRTVTFQDKVKNGGELAVYDKLDVLSNANFRSYLLVVDNDADGAHMRALFRYYFWKRHPEIIEQGKLYDIVPPYCNYTIKDHNILNEEYDFKGEKKKLSNAGTIRTMAEYEIVRKTFSGKVVFILFKGLGSLDSKDIYDILQNPENWSKVPSLTSLESHELNLMFTNSSQFKKTYTQNTYAQESLVRKLYIKSYLYKDTAVDIDAIYDSNHLSDTPIFTGVSRITMEDYENKGSLEIEKQELKKRVANILEEHGGNII